MADEPTVMIVQSIDQVILVPEVSLDQVLTLDEYDMPLLDGNTSMGDISMDTEENGVFEEQQMQEDSQESETDERINPAELLKQLSPHLGLNGEIKDSTEVPAMKEAMKEATKLVSKCVYTNILRTTTDRGVLKTFIEAGGWDMLNDWLNDAKATNNDTFIMELLKVYSQMPISVNLLKQNSCAKTIKHLKSKAENAALKALASELVDKWMATIRQSSDSSTTSSSSSSDKSKKKKSHRDKDGRSDSSSSSSSKKSPRSSEDKHRESPEKDATPFINGSSGTKKPDPSKPRAKTVKTVPTKFRSTGLEMETVLPQASRKRTTEKDSKSLPVKRPSMTIPKTPPEKKPRPALPSPLPSSSVSLEKKGGIKLIPPRPKPVQVYESAGFMDALTTSSGSGPMRRKRKGSGSKPNTPTSPPGSKQPSVPSFYQETLENNEDENGENEQPKSPSDGTSENSTETTEKEGTEEEAKSADGTPVPKKKKKTVSWVDDSQLKQYFYFELDETERVNVNRTKDFASSIKQEMMMERQNVESAKRHHGQDTPLEYMTWRRPRPIPGLTSSVIPGCNSTEKDKQREREQGVLQAIFFSRATIPDTPVEPEPETHDHEEPKTIPLEDETGGTGETVYDSYPAPVESPVPSPGALTLPPDVVNYLASVAQQSQKTTPPMGQVDYTGNHLHQPPPQAFPGQYPQGVGLGGAGHPGMMGGAPSYRGFPPPHPQGPPGHRMPGMPLHGDEEWGENMHGGPMMPPRGHPPPGMPPRGFRGMGPPRGMPPRGRGPPPGPRGPPRVCRHFTSGSGCRFEQDCLFLHPGVNYPL